MKSFRFMLRSYLRGRLGTHVFLPLPFLSRAHSQRRRTKGPRTCKAAPPREARKIVHNAIMDAPKPPAPPGAQSMSRDGGGGGGGEHHVVAHKSRISEDSRCIIATTPLATCCCLLFLPCTVCPRGSLYDSHCVVCPPGVDVALA